MSKALPSTEGRRSEAQGATGPTRISSRAPRNQAKTQPATADESKTVFAYRALLDFHLLLRCERLYNKQHPRRMATLGKAYDSFHNLILTGTFEVLVKRDGLAILPASTAYLPDARGEMQALSSTLLQAGIRQVSFSKNLKLEELDVLAELIKVSLLTVGPGQTPGKGWKGETKAHREEWWRTHLAEREVKGILINTQVDRKVDTLLVSLIATLVAYGGNTQRANLEDPIPVPHLDDLVASLGLLARLSVPLESRRELSAEEGTRAIHAAMDEAQHDTVRLLLSAISQYSPEDGEAPQTYFLRLSEEMIFEHLVAEFAAGTLTPLMVRPTFEHLAGVLIAAGKFASDDLGENYSGLAASWATENYREKIMTRFWLELPPREKAMVLRGPDLWCLPVVALRQTLGNLADAGADAPRREARHILLNYARRLDQEDAKARQAVAAGLMELCPIIESLWPNQLPEDLSLGALLALVTERNSQTATSLTAFLEWLSRVAAARADYEGFEAILLSLEEAPQERERDQVNLPMIAKRLVAQDRWVLLVDAALANRALDPVLPRLLVRDPDRLLDRLTTLLGEPRGTEMLSAMARLLRAIGQPVLSVLETRLYEARAQRVTAAIKLLAATDPDRLLRGLSRALPSWEWNMQDLAVSELSRPANASSAQSAAFVFSTLLASAHPLVVPMMIDQIGLAGERTAIPHLIEVASGQHAILREQFVRIKAIEALGRLRAIEAIEILHRLAERRNGIAFAEPAGLRAAAQDALAVIQDQPASASVRATFDAPTANTTLYPAPRRYMRVPLEAPLRAQIGSQASGAHASLAQVRTISLGGAYLEGPQKFAVGDSLKLQVRSGLRTIHCTAVVRNTAPGGGGVEFVHMKDEDRTKLRKLVLRKLSD